MKRFLSFGRRRTPKDYFLACCHRVNGVVRAGPAKIKPRGNRRG